MLLNPVILQKCTNELKEALLSCSGHEKLRVILELKLKEQNKRALPIPSDFESREDWRRALIKIREEYIAESTHDAIKALEALDIEIIGGGIVLRNIVVDGTAQQIAAAILLPGVQRAILDVEIWNDRISCKKN